MSRNLKFWVAFVSATAILAVAIVAHTGSYGTNSRVTAQSTESGSVNVDSANRPNSEASTEFIASSGISDSSSEIDYVNRSFAEVMATLTEQVRAGDSSAMPLIDGLVFRCSVFAGGGAEPGSQISHTPEQRRMKERLSRFCNSMNDEQIRDALAAERELLLQGDLLAMARHFQSGDALQENFGIEPGDVGGWAWEEAVESDSPELTSALLEALFNRFDTPGARVEETAQILREFNSHPSMLNSGFERQREVRSLGLSILACRQGAQCGPGGAMQEFHCATSGLCASHLGTEQFISQYLLNANERIAVREFVLALEDKLGSNP